MGNVLWHIELSHYNEKARWALDYKGVPYERRVPVPGLHGARALIATRGAQRRLPVLRLDGQTIGDSTAIIAALERHTPDPPLYPADPAELDRALELEEFFDERLGPEIRRFGWHHLLQDPDEMAGSLFTSPHPVREKMLRATAPLAGRIVRADYGVQGDEEPYRAIVAAMDHLEAELGSGDYLVGGRFGVADLTAASLFTPIIRPPQRPFLPSDVGVPALLELEAELTARPGGQWVLGTYARHRGAYAG